MSKTAEGDSYLLSQTAQMVKALNETKGTNAKITLMKTYGHLQPLIKRIYDPHAKTRVTAKGLDDFKTKAKGVPGEAGICLLDLFDQLTAGVLSGDRGRATIWGFIGKYPAHEDLIKCIMEKDLRIRMGLKTVLAVFPGMFDPFPVMLAEEYDEARFNKQLEEFKKVVPPLFISGKIDGVRLLARIENQTVKFYSRSGKEYTSLAALVPDFKFDGSWVVDGELVALDEKGAENFKLTVSAARKKDLQMDNPRFKVFDILPLAVWKANKSGGGKFSDRYAQLAELFKNAKHVEVVEHVPYTPEVMAAWEKKAKAGGWEGLMLRFNAPWEPKRSHYLMKYKFMYEDEFEVKEVGTEVMSFPNEKGGEEKLNAVKNVMIEYKGHPVWVGSGFSKEERLRYVDESLVGQMISVQYQEPFHDIKTDKWSLRCPTLRMVIGKKREF